MTHRRRDVRRRAHRLAVLAGGALVVDARSAEECDVTGVEVRDADAPCRVPRVHRLYLPANRLMLLEMAARHDRQSAVADDRVVAA